ncbi:hypothetical protein GGQ77_000681 [Geobacillus thermodenitrificans]|nr:hypothetical protein [Geobacillus thermodenitrificans]
MMEMGTVFISHHGMRGLGKSSLQRRKVLIGT